MRRATWTVIAFVALGGLMGCKKTNGGASASPSASAEAEEAFGRLTVDDVQSKMDEAKAGKLAFFVFDNNNKDTFAKNHLPGAKWLDHDHVTASDLPADKNATLVFYCANEH